MSTWNPSPIEDLINNGMGHWREMDMHKRYLPVGKKSLTGQMEDYGQLTK